MTLARGGGIGMPVGGCCCSLADVARKDLRLEQIWPQTRRSYLPADRGRALRAFPIRKSLCSLPATRSALFLLLCYLLADVARNATLPSFLAGLPCRARRCTCRQGEERKSQRSVLGASTWSLLA